MGQKCSGLRRPKQKQQQQPTAPISNPPSRPPRSPPLPPHELIYHPSAPNDPHPIVTNLEKEKEEKQEEPDPSSHPYFRASGISIPHTGSPIPQPSLPQPPPLTPSPAPAPALLSQRPLLLLPLPLPPTIPLNQNPISAPAPEIITALSNPHPQWTNTQCRYWLSQVLITYANRPSPVARRLADGFQGWGGSLFLKTREEWDGWLGEDGRAIWALLKGTRDSEDVGMGAREVNRDIGRVRGGLGNGDGIGNAVARRWSLKRGSLGAGVGEKERANKRRSEVGREVSVENEDSKKMQVASEWGKGKGRLKSLSEEREKVRGEKPRPMPEDDRRGKSWLAF
ncbi:hypothetical protein WAI453_011008 [Rhynchosporium graminicola]|uniref:Uncharacterized protein n=1 Tax=Rhynchosporium graminicola TaxID=2792576 RepID=A0A1E1L071_9HELO|nr:uncharacterized protein RCO7_11584 [Rhynchosporium commune]